MLFPSAGHADVKETLDIGEDGAGLRLTDCGILRPLSPVAFLKSYGKWCYAQCFPSMPLHEEFLELRYFSGVRLNTAVGFGIERWKTGAHRSTTKSKSSWSERDTCYVLCSSRPFVQLPA